MSDGAWGTVLQAKGLKPGECPELWNLERPADVEDIGRRYIQAGAHRVGANCDNGMERMVEVVAEMRAASAGRWIRSDRRRLAGESRRGMRVRIGSACKVARAFRRAGK